MVKRINIVRYTTYDINITNLIVIITIAVPTPLQKLPALSVVTQGGESIIMSLVRTSDLENVNLVTESGCLNECDIGNKNFFRIYTIRASLGCSITLMERRPTTQRDVRSALKNFFNLFLVTSSKGIPSFSM